MYHSELSLWYLIYFHMETLKTFIRAMAVLSPLVETISSFTGVKRRGA